MPTSVTAAQGGEGPVVVSVVDLSNPDGTETEFSPGTSGLAVSANGQRLIISTLADLGVARQTDGKEDVFFSRGGRRFKSIYPPGLIPEQGASAGGMSPNGRFIAFWSRNNRFVPGDTHRAGPDLFLYDRRTQTYEMINISTSGRQSVADWPDPNGNIAISRDGRYVAWHERNAQLDPVDVDDPIHWGVYLRDRVAGTTKRIDVDWRGRPAYASSFVHAITPNGRYLTFSSYARITRGETYRESSDVYLRDLQRGTTERISIRSDETEATGYPYTRYTSAVGGAITANGRYVFFWSAAWDFDTDIKEFDTNYDVFVRDRVAGTTRQVTAVDGIPIGAGQNRESYMGNVTPDGRYACIATQATQYGYDADAAGILIADLTTGQLHPVPLFDLNRSVNTCLLNHDATIMHATVYSIRAQDYGDHTYRIQLDWPDRQP